MTRRLSVLFDIRPEETSAVARLFLLYCLLGAANNFVQAAAFPLFAARFGAGALAWTYVANAFVVPALAFLYMAVGRRISFPVLVAGQVGCLALLIAAFRGGLALTPAPWLVFGLPVLFQVLINFGNLAFWSLAGRTFDVRQGKRLFGLIGAGQWFAIVVTGLMIPVLVRWLGAANLLILAALSAGGAVLLVRRVTAGLPGAAAPGSQTLSGKARGTPDRLGTGRARNSPLSGGGTGGSSRYTALIFAMVVLWWLAFYFLDNIFYARAGARFTNPDELAGFLGVFLAGLGVVTLLSNAFLAGRVIGGRGVRAAMRVLPVVLLPAAAAMAAGSVLGANAAILFWLAVGTKVADMSLGLSIDRSALTILYQPLPPAERGQVQATAEGVFQPLASGLAGLGLLALTAAGVAARDAAVFFIVAGWLAVVILLGREYPAALLRALRRRMWDGAGPAPLDLQGRAALLEGLRSPHPAAALYALRGLETAGDPGLPVMIAGLLAHPAAEVRLEALARIEASGGAGALPQVAALVDAEQVPAVRGAAVRVLAALDGERAFERIAPQVAPRLPAGPQPGRASWAGPHLAGPDPLVRVGAIAGLFRSGRPEGVLVAGQALLDLAASADAGERILAAQAIGETGLGGLYRPLLPLLDDPDVEVRRAALAAAGRIAHPRLWPAVIAGLDDPAARGPAAAALAAGGEAALEAIAAAWLRPRPDCGPGGGAPGGEGPAELVRAAGRIGGPAATAWLRAQLAEPDPPVRGHVLAALARCGYRADGEDRGPVEAQIAAEADEAARLLAIRVDLGEVGASPAADRQPGAHAGAGPRLLQDALDAALAATRARILHLLAFLYDPDAIGRAAAALDTAQPDRRSYALEALDALLADNHKRALFPLLGHLRPATRPEAPGRDERLARLVADRSCPDAWLRACAIRAVGELGPAAAGAGLREALAAALDDPAARVREAAVAAASQLALVGLAPRVARLCDDTDAGVRRAAAGWTRDGDHSAAASLDTMNRVMALKGAGIFAGTPGRVLAGLAGGLVEVTLAAGEPLFRRGDPGDTMYVVVDGEICVGDGGTTFNTLAAGEVLGEMAVLDAAPRSASAAAGPAGARLLRIDRDVLYRLIEERPEVAREIIRVLSRRLRARLADLAGYQEPSAAPRPAPALSIG